MIIWWLGYPKFICFYTCLDSKWATKQVAQFKIVHCIGCTHCFLSKASKGITMLNWQITCKSTSLHGHGHCRTSIASSRSQNRCQKECRNICQKVCRNICQIECHIECQSMCWKECQIEWQNKYAIYTSRLVYVRNYVRIVFQGVDHCFFSRGDAIGWLWFLWLENVSSTARRAKQRDQWCYGTDHWCDGEDRYTTARQCPGQQWFNRCPGGCLQTCWCPHRVQNPTCECDVQDFSVGDSMDSRGEMLMVGEDGLR